VKFVGIPQSCSLNAGVGYKHNRADHAGAESRRPTIS
jgi:hypothetical protein